MKTFADFPLSPLLKANLAGGGFSVPTPIQELVIEHALAGKDVVATAPTGTGKTLAFVLPMIELLAAKREPGVRAVILSPTRELAMQIHETFQAMAKGTGLRSAVVVGGMSEHAQLQSIRKGAQVVIATAGRLYDYLSRGLVNLGSTKLLVLDEADRMLGMGFLPTLQRILERIPAGRQTLFFSATIESSVKHLVQTEVPNAVRIELGSSTKPVAEVELHVYEVEQDRKLDLLRALLLREKGSFLVFARTKRGAERLAQRLADDGIHTGAIHGDRSQNQRNQALRRFQDGHYRVLVATDVASRGIHVDGIAHVVNYDLPMVPEDFIHRVGRTGRAGARGTASTFGTRSERGELALLERTLSIRLTRYTDPGKISETQTQLVPAGSKARSFVPRHGFGRRAVRAAV